ncbi:MAG: SRPBCC family protein [Candidatus Zixiibacteriota bacterium]
MNAERTKNVAADTSDREITATRILDAPRDLVFQMWTDSKHLAKWWGPNGFTTTTHEMDVRPGGVWRFIMHGPDGIDYPNKIIYLEVARPERLVYKHSGDEGTEPVNFHVTVTFASVGQKTRLTVRSLFATAAERDEVIRRYGADKGLEQTLDRLAEHLVKM